MNRTQRKARKMFARKHAVAHNPHWQRQVGETVAAWRACEVTATPERAAAFERYQAAWSRLFAACRRGV